MKKRKSSVQMIAIVLSILMILNIPLPVLAQASIENAIEEQQNQPVLLTDRLTETETYWQNADGSISYEAYFEPIRYQDENGAWHEIENDVVQVDKGEKSRDAFGRSSYEYRSKSSKAWTLLDENIRNDEPVKLQFGEYTLSSRPVWGSRPGHEVMQEPGETTMEKQADPENEAEQEAQTEAQDLQTEQEQDGWISFVEKPEEQLRGEERVMVNANAQQTVNRAAYSAEKKYKAAEYNNAFGEDTVLRITPVNEGYKEELFLLSKPEQDSFAFELTTNGLVLELDENKVVWMKNAQTQETIGCLPAPYMEDSSELEEQINDSTNIQVTLENRGNGRYLYTLTPDKAWLEAETTVYPVKIDPSASISGSNQADRDVTDTGTVYNNAYAWLRVGRDSDGHKYRSYLKFTLPSDLSGTFVWAAALHTYQGYAGASNPDFSIHKVLSKWSSSSLVWNNQPSFSANAYQSQAVSGVKDHTWNITPIVQEWANGDANYGIVIKATNETPKRYKRFASSDNTEYPKPKLNIEYYPVNLDFTATAVPGAINSSQGSINVSWAAPPNGVTAKVVLNGTEYTPNNANGANTHKFSGVSSYVRQTIKIRFTGKRFDKSTAYKDVWVEDRTPPIFNTTSQATIANGKLQVDFARALKPNSVRKVEFPTWTTNNGQDDCKWHLATNSGNGTWSCTVNLSDHKNERGEYNVHCYVTTVAAVFDFIAEAKFDVSGNETRWEGQIVDGDQGSCGVAHSLVIERESPASDTFTITMTGVSMSQVVTKHELYWAELGSEELHLLDTIPTEGVGNGRIQKSYDIKDNELPSGATINIYAKATDRYGNYTVPNLLLGTVDIPNYVPPQAPQLSVHEGNRYYTMGQDPLFPVKDSVTVRWNIEKGMGSDFDIAYVQYSADGENWATVSPDHWLDKGEGKTAAINGAVISTETLPDGINRIYVRGVDNNPVEGQALAGDVSSIQILKDTQPPVLHVTYPQSTEEIEGVPVWNVRDKASITNIDEARLKTIKVEAGRKLTLAGQPFYAYQTLYEWTDGINAPIAYPIELPLYQIPYVNGAYGMRITVMDHSGNVVTEQKEFVLVSDASYQAPSVYLKQIGAEAYESMIHITQVPVVLEVIGDSFRTDLDYTTRLLVDGQPVNYTFDEQNKQITINVLDEQNQAIFVPGTWHSIRFEAEYPGTGDKIYSYGLYADTKNAVVENNISNLQNMTFTDGHLVVQGNTGSFDYQGPAVGPGQLQMIDFSSLEDAGLPENTTIDIAMTAYGLDETVISTQTLSYQIGAVNSSESLNAGYGAYGYTLHFTITLPQGNTETVLLDQLTFCAKYGGDSTQVCTELIAPASNLSAMPLVNYTTWLRWTGSPTQGAVYDIYRSEADTLDLESATPIATNLTTTYYYDHDLIPEKTFNYWVVAKKEYQVEGETVTMFAQSQPSPKQTATMVDENELEKQLGLQNYWSYAAVPVGNATGYINVSSGNLVYQQVDLEMVAPLLASTMRRTYNSQAQSYTSLGKGWDFGLNTNLLREYDKTTGEEVGLILKDGDGTIHRFAKQADGGYQSPAGVFITLTQREDGKYTAHRSDDIDYLFNASMMIEEFSEPNGNKLLFTYDERGRLIKVMHSLYTDSAFTEEEQQYFAFVYGEQPHNQDKIVKVIAHYGGADDTAIEDTYLYTYGSDENDPSTYGMLVKVATAGKQTYTYVETNAEGMDAVSSTQSMKTIEESYAYQEGENNVFTIGLPANTSETGVRTHRFDLDAQNRVIKSTDAVSSYVLLTYNIPEGNETYVETTINGYIDGTNTNTGRYTTDQAHHGVTVEVIEPGNRVTVLSDYDYEVLKPGKITVYGDDDRTQSTVYSMEYNHLGNVTKVITPDGVRHTMDYVQKDDGTVTNWPTSNKSYQGDTLINRVDYSYDAKGNLLSEELAVKNPAAFTDTKITSYTYDARGQRLSQTDWNGKATTYAYDGYGRLQTMTETGSGITLATSYTYDARNNPTTKSIARGNKALITRYTYDGFGRLLSAEQPDGQKEVNNYNKSGMIVSKVFVGAPASDGGSTQAKVETYRYDNVDRLIEKKDPIGNVSSSSFVISGEDITTKTVTKGEDGITRTSTESESLSGKYKISLQGDYGTKSYFDKLGNTVKITQVYKENDELKETRPMYAEYDVMGRVTRTYDESNLTETRTNYDVYGNVLREWNYVETQNGIRMYTVKQYSYDLEGRVTSVREKTTLRAYSNADVGISGDDLLTAYTYDNDGGGSLTYDVVTSADGSVTKTYKDMFANVTREIQQGKNTNAKGLTKEYIYDSYGRKTGIKVGASSTSVRQTFEYDELDRLKEQKNGSASTKYTYDYFGRRASMTDTADGISIMTTWKYDKNDNAVQLLQDGKVVNYRYDSAGDMIAMQYGAMGNVRTIGYEYDDSGRVLSVKSSVVPAAEDGAPMDTSELKTVKAYSYAANGDLSSTTEYLEFDRKSDKEGATLVGTYTFDGVGRPLSVTYTQNGVQKEKYTYAFDGQGYITREEYVDAYQDTYTNQTTETTVRNYRYDPIGRLKQSTVTKGQANKTSTYEYDKVGNRIKETKTETMEDGKQLETIDVYTYNNLHQLTGITQSATLRADGKTATYSNQPIGTYTYDDFGNQITSDDYEVDWETKTTHKTKETRNTYDNSNQLIKVEERKTGQNWTELYRNVYNGEGQRVRKIDGNSTNGDYTMYFYMGGALAFSTNSDANYITDENVLDPNGIIVAGKRQDNIFNAEKPEGQYWIYHYDARDSVTNIVGTDQNSSLFRAEKNVYDSFGKDDSNKQEPMTSIQNEVKFTGAVQDSNGLYYMSARHYDANTGRFLQQDTFKGDIYSPWSQNLYTYTSNNPVNYKDPTGHLVGAIFGAIWGGIKAAYNGENVWRGMAVGAAKGLVMDAAIAAGPVGVIIAPIGTGLIEGTDAIYEIESRGLDRRANAGYFMQRVGKGMLEGGTNFVVGGLWTGGYPGNTGTFWQNLIKDVKSLKVFKEAFRDQILYIGPDMAVDHATTALTGGVAKTKNTSRGSKQSSTLNSKTTCQTTRGYEQRRSNAPSRKTKTRNAYEYFIRISYLYAGQKMPDMSYFSKWW